MQYQTEKQNQTEKLPQASSLENSIEIGFLAPEEAEFFKTPGGFTGLTYRGTEYKRISLRRVLPIGQPTRYISVADSENKEIAIIRDIAGLSAPQIAIVEDELSKRYYCPRVYEIKSVKDKMGYVYMELVIGTDTEKYDKNCAVKDVNRNIRMIDDNRLLIFDVDGNRYMVSDVSALDKKSLGRLEPYMF